MGLKADRREVDSVIDYFMNQTADRGGLACISTSASGAAMDNSVQLAHYPTNPSGQKPLGILMSDVKNLDLTRQDINGYREEVQAGGKVTIWTKGTVVTDYIASGVTVAGGDVAYVGAEGRFTNVSTGYNAIVGRFDTAKDEEGFAKVTVNLP